MKGGKVLTVVIYQNNNQVYTVLFGPAVKRSSLTDGNKYNHYSILASVEENVSLITKLKLSLMRIYTLML
jgi:hypothetical protein